VKILIACEYSGIVRDAFIKKGHEALSCDLLPTESYGPHYQGNVMDVIDRGWDMMIAHPPCTHFSKAGAWAWKFKKQKQLEGLEFVRALFYAPIDKIAIENPIGWLNTHWMKPSQIIHPFYFGDPWMKETCFWLKNLPPLRYSINGDLFNQKTAVEPLGNWVKPGNKRPHRRFDKVKEGGGGNPKERARFFPAIAAAMADQWG
jgi:site-specific DNA-cytosine methylase